MTRYLVEKCFMNIYEIYLDVIIIPAIRVNLNMMVQNQFRLFLKSTYKHKY